MYKLEKGVAMHCRFCGWGTNDGKPAASHDPACPLASGKLDESKKIAFDSGYRHGRQGFDTINPDDRTYILGWLRGDAAAEEATNGFDPRFA
jgi:hypothetical protein